MTTRVAAAGIVAELGLHGLSCVPLSGVERLFHLRYVEWARASLPRAAIEPLASDGAAIGADLDARGAGLAVQSLPWLTDDLDAFVRAAAADSGAAVIDAGARILGAGIVGADWLHADLALAAEAFASARPASASDVEATVSALSARVATARGLDWPEAIEVAYALGARGRGVGHGRVVVGACAAWNGLGPETPAVVALHEQAVMRGTGAYAAREWAALRSVARALVSGPAVLRTAHASWIAGLDLEPLLRPLVSAGAIDGALARALRDEPGSRAERLARI